MVHKFKPTTRQEFWCSVCDGQIVDSADENTGQFYCAFGHVWIPKKQDIGDEHMIIFAVCPNCKDQIVEK